MARSYELRRNGQIVGTYSSKEIHALSRSNELTPADELRRVGESRWYPISAVRGLNVPADSAPEPTPTPVASNEEPIAPNQTEPPVNDDESSAIGADPEPNLVEPQTFENDSLDDATHESPDATDVSAPQPEETPANASEHDINSSEDPETELQAIDDVSESPLDAQMDADGDSRDTNTDQVEDDAIEDDVAATLPHSDPDDDEQPDTDTTETETSSSDMNVDPEEDELASESGISESTHTVDSTATSQDEDKEAASESPLSSEEDSIESQNDSEASAMDKARDTASQSLERIKSGIRHEKTQAAIAKSKAWIQSHPKESGGIAAGLFVVFIAWMLMGGDDSTQTDAVPAVVAQRPSEAPTSPSSSGAESEDPKRFNVDKDGVPLLMWTYLNEGEDAALEMVEGGADLDKKGMLIAAVEANQPEFIAFCARQGADMNVMAPPTQDDSGSTSLESGLTKGTTPLDRAIYRTLAEGQSTDCIKALVTGGATLEDWHFINAMEEKNKDVIQALFMATETFEPDDRSGRNSAAKVAKWAWEEEDFALVEKILDMDVDPWKVVPLAQAINQDQEELVTRLLEYPSKPDKIDPDALIAAATKGNEALAITIIKAGGQVFRSREDIDAPGIALHRSGMDKALATAVEMMPDTLLEDRKIKEQLDDLMLASAYSGHKATIQSIVKRGIPARWKSDDNDRKRLAGSLCKILMEEFPEIKAWDSTMTPLLLAVVARDQETVSLLLEAGADPNQMVVAGHLDRYFSIEGRDIEIPTYFQPMRAAENIRGLYQDPAAIGEEQLPWCNGRLKPLIFEALRTPVDLDIAQTLIDFGADIDAVADPSTNLKVKWDMNAMHYAAAFGEPECIAWLHEKGLSYEEPDQHGRTPIVYAVMTSGLGSEEDQMRRSKNAAAFIASGIDVKKIHTGSETRYWIEPMNLLMLAVATGGIPTVDVICQHAPELVDSPQFFTYHMPMQVAASLEPDKANACMEILLEHSNEIDALPGATAEALVHESALVPSWSHVSLSPLSIAVGNLNLDLVKRLVNAGASLNARYDTDDIAELPDFVRNADEGGSGVTDAITLEKDLMKTDGIAGASPLGLAVMKYLTESYTSQKEGKDDPEILERCQQNCLKALQIITFLAESGDNMNKQIIAQRKYGPRDQYLHIFSEKAWEPPSEKEKQRFGYEPKPVNQRQLHSYDPPRPQTPLEVAIWNLSPELVEHLLANGSTVTKRALNMSGENIIGNEFNRSDEEVKDARDQIANMLKAEAGSETTTD